MQLCSKPVSGIFLGYLSECIQLIFYFFYLPLLFFFLFFLIASHRSFRHIFYARSCENVFGSKWSRALLVQLPLHKGTFSLSSQQEVFFVVNTITQQLSLIYEIVPNFLTLSPLPSNTGITDKLKMEVISRDVIH